MCMGGKEVGIQTPDMPLQEQMGVTHTHTHRAPQTRCVLGIKSLLFLEMAVGLQPTAPPTADQDI